MECFIGFLKSRRFFRHQSWKHVTCIRQVSKLLLLPFKYEAGEVHGDVLLAVHLKCSISKPPYICHMFTRLVSKEASGLQESNKALQSHLKICFQPKKWRKPSRPVSPLWLLCEKGIPSSDRKEQDRALQIFLVSSDIISITYLCRKKSFLKLLIFWATLGGSMWGNGTTRGGPFGQKLNYFRFCTSAKPNCPC